MRKCIEDVTALQLRLKKIIGQLAGVQKMLAAAAHDKTQRPWRKSL